MLSSLFPSFFGKSDNGGTNLSSGGTPGQLNGDTKNVIFSYASIPDTVSQKDVDEVARDCGEIEADGVLMKVWSEHALNAQRAALSNLDTRINHAQAAMGNEENYRKKISKHGKNYLAHRIDVNATKQNFDGYQNVLSNAESTIAF
ncbi:hypothetical protein [Anabaena azotica]|uniref:CpcD n=1 Tax=Anabaena azotica FACHB-119 TaxID=947527 RepID=A0ABR8D9R1_9NOST|nr:hypothetical protein [Anabaena azotica]MBD2503927.1 hypothetical protein [Anabaena azotica FACHB-119]